MLPAGLRLLILLRDGLLEEWGSGNMTAAEKQ